MEKITTESLSMKVENIPGMSYDKESGPTASFRKKKAKKSKSKRKTKKDCGCK